MKRSRSRDPRNHANDDDHDHGDDDDFNDPHTDHGYDPFDHLFNRLTMPLEKPASTLAKTRDALVAFAAGHGVPQVSVSRRISQYLRTERLFAAGGYRLYPLHNNSHFDDQGSYYSRMCYSVDDLIVEGMNTCSWEDEVCRMKENRSDFSIAVLRGDLWAVGGGSNRDESYSGDALKSCERLEAGSSMWVNGPDMSTARKFLAVAVLADEVWAIGGCGCDGTVLSSCERLTVGGVWTQGPAMTAPWRYHQAVVLDGVLWVVDGESCETVHLDVSTQQWVRGPPLKHQRKYFSLAVFRGRLWAVGGMCGQQPLESTEYLDDDIWLPGPSMRVDRINFGLAEHDGHLWAVGGESYDQLGNETLRSCEILTVHDDGSMFWFPGPKLPIPTCGLCCCVRP